MRVITTSNMIQNYDFIFLNQINHGSYPQQPCVYYYINLKTIQVIPKHLNCVPKVHY